MLTSTLFASFTILLCTSFSVVDARVIQREVVSPPITSPTAGTKWNVNERHNVTWDTSVIPPGDNRTGMLVLGFLEANDSFNEHLDLNNPLAKGFQLTTGSAEITVPAVQTRNSYIIVLFGDSGNASPPFTITNISITGSSSVVVPSSSSFASADTTDAQSGASSSVSSTALSSQVVSVSSTDSPMVSGSTTAVSAPVTSASASTTASVASSVTQAQPAAAQSSTSANAGIRSASYGGAATWISTIFSLAFFLGFAL